MDHDSHSGTEMYFSDSSVRISSKHSSENEQFVMEVDTLRRQSTPPPYQDQPTHSLPQNPIYGNAPQLPTVVTREEPLPASSSSGTQIRPRSHTSAVSKPNLSPHHLRQLSTSNSASSSPSAHLNISMPDLRNGFQPQSPRGEPNIVFPFIPVSQLPLPSAWELGYTKKGRPYFIDHVNQRTTFEDPRFPPGYVPTVVLSSTPSSTHNTNSANNNNVPSTTNNSSVYGNATPTANSSIYGNVLTHSNSSSIYGNVDAERPKSPVQPTQPTSPVYGNSFSSYNTGSLRPSASAEKPPIVRVSSKEGPPASPTTNRLSLSLSNEALLSSTASLANTLSTSSSVVGLSHSGSVESVNTDSNESYPVPSSIPLATASGVPASTKIALDPKFNSRRKYKDVILSQIQNTKEDCDRAHKQNVSQASKFKDQKEKAAILKHQTDLQHMEKQHAQQMKQKVKEIELTQNAEKKKCKSRWKEEQKQDEDKASSLPWQNKDIVQKQLGNQLKEKQQQLDHFHVLQHLELTQQLMRQQQKQLFEEKIKQAIEDSDFLIDFSVNSLKEEREHHRKVNEISLKILQRIHALNRTEMMEEHRKQQDQLAAQIKEEHKSKTKEFKAQEKERKKEQEKALKKELSQNKSANKKELQAAYDAENEKLYHKHLQVLEKKKEEEEVSLHQKQMKLQEELRQSQYALEQQQARELFEKDQKHLSEHAEKVQRDIQNVFKNCKKYFQEKDNLIPVLQQHITMLFSKLDEQLMQHQNLIKEQYDKLVALYDKESDKERQASIKLERKSMRDKRATVRSGVTESSGIEDKMSFLQQVHVKNQKIVRQKAWYQRQEMYLLCGRNHAEKGVLVNKRNLLSSKHREESDLVEFVGVQLKEMANHFFHIAYNSWKSFLEERAGLVESYQPYIDAPITMPADTNLAMLEATHDERTRKFDSKLEQTRASVRKQLQDEMQEFEAKYDRTLQTHNLQEDKLKAEHDNDLRLLESKFEKQIEEIQQEYGIFPQPRSMERSASSSKMTNRAEFKVGEPRQVMSSPEVVTEDSHVLKKVVNEKDEEIVQLRKQLTDLQKKYTMKEMSNQFSSVRHEVFDIREDLAKHKDDVSVASEDGVQEPRSRSATTDSENSPFHSDSPTPLRVVALFAFTQRKDDQLSFVKGDIITVLKQRKSGWWKGELNGRVGKFPSNYCKVLDDRSRSASVASAETKYSAEPGPSSQPPALPQHHHNKEPKYVRALYTYTQKKSNQLSFAKGDIIKVVEEKKSGWWIGELNGHSGKFPSNFCETITDKEEIKNAIAASDQHDEETEEKGSESDTGKMRRALDVLKSLEVYEDSNENSDLSNLKNEFDVGNLTLAANENRNHDLHSETDTDQEQLNLKLNIATANQKLPTLTETDKANALLELERLLVDSDDEEEEVEVKVVAPAVAPGPRPVNNTATRALVEDSEDDQTSEVFFKRQMGLQSQHQTRANAGSMRESDYLNKIKMLLEQGGSSEEE